MNSIVVPINFSNASSNALNYALVLAKTFNSKITLLHAYHTIPANPEFESKNHEDELADLRQNTFKKLQVFKDEIKQVSIDCDIVNEEGYPIDVILKHANHGQTDLLLMGTEQIMPIDKIIFGTITGKVLKEVQCPILIVPEESNNLTPKKMAFATDYHDNDSDNLIFLNKMSQKFNSELSVVRVAPKGEDQMLEDRLMNELREKVDSALPDNNINWQLLSGSNVNKQLEQYMSESELDLLAAVRADHNFIEKWLSWSVTQKLFYKTHIPLLIFHAKDSDLREDRIIEREDYE